MPGDRPPPIDRLAAAGARYGYPADAPARLLRAVEEVLLENERVNLTGARTLDDAVDVLALDAMPVAAAWPEGRPPPRRALDLGTGNGFPGAAVAVRWPAAAVVLVERRAKKAAAVARALGAAGLRVETLACDGREVPRRRPDLAGGVDLVVVRAVGDLAPTTREAAPLLAPGGVVVHWKSADVSDEERREGEAAALALGLRARPDHAFHLVPGRTPRLLVSFERPA